MRAVVASYFGALLLLLVGCDARSLPQSADGNRLTQVSIINALMLGQYDGVMTIGELLRYGNFGLGTCDHLDGELIILDGRAYQAKADGTVVEAAAQSTTPFALITPFDKTAELRCTNVSGLEELERRLDSTFANQDLFLAIRVDADFDSITFRSVPRQEPPYVRLAEVAKQQAVWTQEKATGTLVGFRCPKWANGLNVPGYHWHFLSSDHKRGGHVLECRIRAAIVRYSPCDSWLIKLDESRDSKGTDLNVDLSHELEKVERLRGAGDEK